MAEVSITDLEAELACFEPGLPQTAPRQGHGSSDTFFDAPPETTSRLEPPSKTKSVYPFGENGTLGWATPAGELLSVASSVDNRLVGIEYKRSIERGQHYYKRGEMLEIANNASHGSGYGIGLSLDVNVHPSDVSWIHNRWPRYIYQHDGLEIRLQYYVESQSVIQQYQIRNNGQKDLSLPYVITSDVCFLEHGIFPGTLHSIPSGKCPERLLLTQNSEVLIRSAKCRAQSEMALFLNGEPQSLWAHEPLGDMESHVNDSDDIKGVTVKIKGLEERIQKSIDTKKLLPKYEDLLCRYAYEMYYKQDKGQDQPLASKQNSFATHREQLLVPGGSTQELSAVIQVSGFTGSGLAPKDELELEMNNISGRQRRLAARASNFSLDKTDPRSKERISEFVKEHIGLGEACAKVERIGEGRYHFYMAYLIAESCCKDNQHTWNTARSKYSGFLDDTGCHRTALSIVKGLIPDLFSGSSGNGGNNDSSIKIIDQVASILLKNRKFEEAKALYEKGLNYFNENITDSNTESAHYLERVALTQAYQKHDREAYEIYLRLSSGQWLARQIILSNLAFIERRRRQFSEAIVHYELSLKEPRGEMDNVPHARSGLYTCLRELNADPGVLANVRPSSIHYVDVNSALSLPLSLPLSVNLPSSEKCFSFAIARQLECLLSVCSIPLKVGQSSRGIAFTDVDPLNCGYGGRIAYFQFRFLIQCQMYFRSMQKDEDANQHIHDRICSVCEGHLVWAFQIADSTRTWVERYLINGSRPAKALEPSSDNSSITYAVQGAFQFLKLCLYLRTWNEKWKFVLELLHLKLGDWLSYLGENQHMANLWIEAEDFESFKPYNSVSKDVGYIRRFYPHYRLSDAALIWLALLHVGKAIEMLESKVQIQTAQNAGSTESQMKDIRQWFDTSQEVLSLQRIRSSILKTFKVPKRGANAPFSAGGKTGFGPTKINYGASEPDMMLDFSNSALPGFQATEALPFVRDEASKMRDQQVIVFHRTINDSTLEIEASDFAAIEASILGIFEGSQDHVGSAWRATLKLQEEKDISAVEDPRQIALTMFASRFRYSLASSRVGKLEDMSRNRLRDALYDSGFFSESVVEDTPGPMRAWNGMTYETMSLLIGGLFKECREILLFYDGQERAQPFTNALALLMTGSRPPIRIPISMSGPASSSSKMNQTSVVVTDFLPDWMYHYPDFIHNEKLEIKVRKKLQQLSSVKSLAPAVDGWKASKRFDNGEHWKVPFPPAVVDSGIKHKRPNQTLAEHEISIHCFYDRDKFWEWLNQSRTPEKAKKRLVEVSSQDKDSVLICYLTASEEENRFFLEFFRRHESSESFFGERAHWQGNVWETEFHLGFYELLDAESVDDNDNESNYESDDESGDGSDHESTSTKAINEDSQSQSSKGQTSGQPISTNCRRVKPVALSFRFVGDLLDRFYTCHFFSSVTDGFKGIIDGYYGSTETQSKLYDEKQSQRKVLELVYVEKALGQMRRSTEKILNAFQSDLDASEAKARAGESINFIHDYSRLYLEIGKNLQTMSRQLGDSLITIEQWEKREETRGLRSRWSQKDEERHGKKLRNLMMKCKIIVQQLRVQQGRLREQERSANQRHNILVSDKALHEARMSTQQAADVRLFTYVTIIFLPLSFSSSLFSMAEAPKGSTIYVMVPTTAIALILTFLLLGNLKLMDRHWSSWINQKKAHAREKMRASERWKDISIELEETTQRRLIESDFERNLPAESNWWYVKFWLSYSVGRVRNYTYNGLRAWEAREKLPTSRPHEILASLLLMMICVLILIVYTTVMMTVDIIHLQWALVGWLGRKMLSAPKEARAADEAERVKTTAEVSDLKRPGRLRTAITFPITWLASSPRPIRTYIRKVDPAPGKQVEQDGRLAQDTADFKYEATGSQQNEVTETTSFIAKLRSKWRNLSNTRHDESNDTAMANEGSIIQYDGPQNAAQPDMPGSTSPQPPHTRKFPRKSRALGPGSDEPRMWVGWSSV